MVKKIRFSRKSYFPKKALIRASIFVFAFTQIHFSVLAEDEQSIPEQTVEQPSLPTEGEVAVSSEEETQPSLPVEEEPITEINTVEISPEQPNLPTLDPEETAEQESSVQEETTLQEENTVIVTEIEQEETSSTGESILSSGEQLTLPPVITILESQIDIGGSMFDALFTRDANSELRQIELQQEATLISPLGITIIIPEDTKIFAPISDQPIILEGDFELPLEEEIQRVIEDVQSGVTVITTIEDDAPVSQDPLAETDLPVDAQSPIVDEIDGQLPLISDDITIDLLEQTPLSGEIDITTDKAFAFGIGEQHVVFTKPVEIHVTLSGGITENSQIVLRVKHEGEFEFGTRGLSVDTNAQCDNFGNTTIPGEVALVQSGKVVFYTCGASEFSVGVLHITTGNVNNVVTAIAVQPDGKILVGGMFTGVNGTTLNRLARLTSTGIVDTTFTGNVNNVVNAIAVQTDGNILIGGMFTGVNGTLQNRLARVTSTGIVDPTFSGYLNQPVNAIVVSTGGSIFIAGSFTGGVFTGKYLTRKTSTGLTDVFEANIPAVVFSMALQPGGNLFIGGNFTSTNGVGRQRLSLISATSSPGLNYNPFSGLVNNSVLAMALQPDGNLIIGGVFTGVQGVTRNRIARVAASGTVDPNFNPNANGTVSGIQLLDDGRILIAGGFTTVNGVARTYLALLTSTGLVDPTFVPLLNAGVNTIALDPLDQSVYIGGSFTSVDGFTRNRFARMGLVPASICGDLMSPLGIGLLDAEFNPNANGTINVMGRQSNNCLILGGSFTTVGGVAKEKVARVTTTGLLDTSFGLNLDGTVMDVLVDTGDNIILGGTFTTGNGTALLSLARVTSTGLLNSTFTGRTNGTVNALALQPDGKILVGGTFGTLNGVSPVYLGRITSTGERDTSFVGNINGWIQAMAIQPDGMIVLGGAFTQASSTTVNYVTRVTSTGLRDTGFTGMASYRVHAVALEADGQVIIGGQFTGVQGVARNYLARLSTTGLLDTTFDPNLNASVSGIRILSDGRILIGGMFTTVGGIPQNHIALLQPDGTLDMTFTITANNSVSTFAVDGLNAVYVGGTFTTINNTVRNGGAKIGLMNSTACGTLATGALGAYDASFNASFNGAVVAVGVQSNGCIIFGGTFTTGGAANTARNRIARTTMTGLIDPVFDPNLNAYVTALAVDVDDSIIAVGGFTTGGANLTIGRIVRITSTGLIDPGFIGNVSAQINTLALQPDRKILIGGSFTTVNGVARSRLARVTSDGLVDQDFTGNVNGTVSSINVQPDGNIIIAGAFTRIHATTGLYLARLTSTGLFDTTFSGRANNTIITSVLQPDGNILIGGTFTGVHGVARNRIARVSSTGALDPSFNPDINGTVSGIQLLSDGRMLVGGLFTLVSSGLRTNVVLLQPDGTVDPNFDLNLSAAAHTFALDKLNYGVYMVGEFLNVDGIEKRRAARITLTTPSICSAPYGISIGALDTVFNPDVNGSVNTLGLQMQNCLILGGDFTTVGGVARNRLARVTQTGAVDPNFDPNINGQVNDVVLDTGDNIIVGGDFTTVGGVARNYIARLSSTGLLDSSFTGNMDGGVDALALQDDGKIVVGGEFTLVQGVTRNRLARVTSTGQVDSTFVSDFDVDGVAVHAIGVQTDGKIVVGGDFNIVEGVTVNYITRLTSTGLRDVAFTGNANNSVEAVAIQSDGDIIIGGAFTGVQGVARNYIARLSSTGLLDTTFNPNLNNTVTGIKLLSDGRILVGGSFTTVGGVNKQYMTLLQPDGSVDTTFAATGNSHVYDFAVDALTSVYVAGAFTEVNNTTRNRLARVGLTSLTGCGDLSSLAIGVGDFVFNPNANNTVLSMIPQPNGCIILGGSFGTVNGGTVRNRLARVTMTGLVDSTFNPNVNSTVNAVALQPDGMLVAGGAFTTGGANVTLLRIARFTSTGQIDPSFTGNLNSTPSTIVMLPDGKMIIGGNFTIVGGISRSRLARLKPNGSPDISFTGNMFGTDVRSIALQPDGSMIIGGTFTSGNALPRRNLARMTSTGQIDPSFTGNVNNTINAVVLQPDGMAIIGGLFTGVNGTERNRLARVTSTGILDLSFDPYVTGASAQVNDIKLLPDGRILIAGTFTLVNGIARSNIALLLPNGLVDTTFASTLGSPVNTLTLDSLASSIYVGGQFTTIDGITINRAARIGLLNSTCAGLSGCAVWFKADAGLNLIGGSAVTGWSSQGLRPVTGIQTTGAWQPTYVTGALNENPVVRFDGISEGLIASNNQIDNDATQFVIFRSLDMSGSITTTSTASGYNGTTCGRAFQLSGGKVSTVLSGVRLSSTITSNTDAPQLATRKYGTGISHSLSFKGKSDVTNGTRRPVAASDVSMLIGRAAFGCSSGDAFSGDIAEILTFHRAVSATEEQYVESYLSLKYGITLDQTSATDYILPGSITAWDSFIAGVYNNDIAGIGRDNSTSLNQLKSQSVNSTGDISLQFTGTFADDQFLTWSNDRGITTGWLTSDIPANYNRLGREWFFQENYGDLGQTIVRIASGALPSIVTGNLVMFIDADGSFNAGAVPFTGTLSGSSWEFNVNIHDTEYITFAYYEAPAGGLISIIAPTTLPYTGLLIPSYQAQTVAQHFNSGAEMYFAVQDGLGEDAGYYTTLQLSGNLTTGAYSIPATQVSYKVSSTGTDLLAGTTNPRVVVDNAAINYQHLGSIRTFILRDPTANGGVVGTYGSFIWLQIAVPAQQPPGAYQGTLVYTIIEN